MTSPVRGTLPPCETLSAPELHALGADLAVREPWPRRDSAGNTLPASELRVTACIGLLLLLGLACLAWWRPLMLPDEGRYVGVAWEMLRSGQWLTPTLDGMPYFHKPPLFYWITATSMAVLGPSVWAARTAPVLGGWLGVFAMYLFARAWAGERRGRDVLLVLLAQPLYYLGAQFANLDMLVAGLVTATIVLLAHTVLLRDRRLPHGRWLLLAYAMAALGVMAKGLIGFVLPALVIGSWLIVRRQWRSLAALISLPGVLVFTLLAAPWFLAMQQRFPDFLHYFFVVQHFQRFASSGFNNVQPFWFYPVLLALCFLPWTPWLRSLAVQRQQRDAGDNALTALMVIWALVIAVFFSLPKSKLIGYILPALPPLAWLVAAGRATVYQTSSPWGERAWRLVNLAGVVVSLVVITVMALHPHRSTRELAQALAQRMGPRDRVVMLDNYYFDLPFYAGLQNPVSVIRQWDDPAVRKVDSWPKELVDAADFSAELGRQLLIKPADLGRSLCGRAAVWLIGPSTALSLHPALQGATLIQTVRATSLWRIGADAVAKSAACRALPGGP